MSDFDPHQLPAAPPSGATPPPPPSAPFGAAGYPQAPGYPQAGPPPIGYVPMQAFGQKPPRPKVVVGSVLLIVGGVLLILGSFLTWFTLLGEDINGFYTAFGESNDGPVFMFLAVLSIGFGIAQLAARKVLAVAILAVVFASFAVIAAVADVSDLQDLLDAGGEAVSGGPGLWVILIGSLIALGGAIATLSARRRWPTPS